VDSVRSVERRVDVRLQALDALFTRAGMRYALIGATAILLHGIRLPRTTRDLDFAVAVGRDIEEVRALLEADGLRSSAVPHRFIAEEGVEVDILPVAAGDDSQRVSLPGGPWISAVGLREAIETAKLVPVSQGTIRVAQLLLLAAIKLHTATLRMGGPDLGDALAVLGQYEDAGDRRFDVDYLTRTELTWETAGAWLAGQDAQAVLRPESLSAVLNAVEELRGDARLSDRFAGGPDRLAQVDAFRAGLAAAA
jgi:predicted nucleotidyltransferase